MGVRNTTARGSGFVVDFVPKDAKSSCEDGDSNDIYLLTAAHVALPGYRIQVVFYMNQDDTSFEEILLSASVVRRDTLSDLALLRVHLPEDSMFTPPSPLIVSNQSKAVIGTPAYAMGYPSGGMVGPAVTSGIVSGNALGLVTAASRNNTTQAADDSYSEDGAKTQYVVTDAAMAGGMSGGPLINGNTGTVLGLNALINVELRALGNYAVSAKECHRFLHKLSVSSDSEENDQSTTMYQVVLYNDRFNKRERVQSLLQNVAELNSTVSNQVMMDAHTKGRGVVREFSGENDVEEAKKLRDALRKEDLLVELETTSH